MEISQVVPSSLVIRGVEVHEEASGFTLTAWDGQHPLNWFIQDQGEYASEERRNGSLKLALKIQTEGLEWLGMPHY